MASAPPESRFESLELSLRTALGPTDIVFEFDAASDVQRGMRATLAAGAFYEAETTLFLLSVLRPGDRFVDVGGHVGYFSVIASRAVGPSGRVFTFEPAPDNYARLVRHLTLNGCGNVVPFHAAAAAEGQGLTLHLNSDNDGGHALWDVRHHPLNARSRAMPRAHPTWAVRVADAVGRERVRAIKLDIEGAELVALQGAEPLLVSDDAVPFVVAEINRGALQALGTSEEALRAWMHERGYDTWHLRVGDPQLHRLDPGVSIESNHVFNVLFWKRGVALG